MSNRYNWGHTTFLNSGERTTVYQSKRNKNGFKSTFDLLTTKHKQNTNIIYPKTYNHQSQLSMVQKPERQISLNAVKTQLNNILQRQAAQVHPESHDSQHNESSNINKKQKIKGNIFRVTVYRNKSIRAQREDHQEMVSQMINIKNELIVHQIHLKNRNVIKDKQNPFYSFKRDVLRFHGENKCFEKTVKHKIEENNGKEDSFRFFNNNLSESKSKDSLGSLQYSRNEAIQVQPWKRGNRDIQQIQLSMLQN